MPKKTAGGRHQAPRSRAALLTDACRQDGPGPQVPEERQQHWWQGDAAKSSILTCWLRTSFYASSTNSKTSSLLSPKLQIKARAVVQLSLGTQAASQNEHTGRTSVPPAGSGATDMQHISSTAHCHVLGVIPKPFRTLLPTSFIL